MLTNSVAPGQWTIVSVPAACTPGAPCKIVVRRVNRVTELDR